jgi:hypothetical protein
MRRLKPLCGTSPQNRNVSPTTRTASNCVGYPLGTQREWAKTLKNCNNGVGTTPSLLYRMCVGILAPSATVRVESSEEFLFLFLLGPTYLHCYSCYCYTFSLRPVTAANNAAARAQPKTKAPS